MNDFPNTKVSTPNSLLIKGHYTLLRVEVDLTDDELLRVLVGAGVVDGGLVEEGGLVVVAGGVDEGGLVEEDAGIVLVENVVLLAGFPPLAQYEARASSTLSGSL